MKIYCLDINNGNNKEFKSFEDRENYLKMNGYKWFGALDLDGEREYKTYNSFACTYSYYS